MLNSFITDYHKIMGAVMIFQKIFFANQKRLNTYLIEKKGGSGSIL